MPNPKVETPRPSGSQWVSRLPMAVAFAAIVMIAANLRSAVTSVPPLVDRIEAQLGLASTVVGFLGSLPPLAFAAAGMVGVRLLRRFSAERIAVGVLLVEALGQAIRPWTGTAVGFLTVTVLTLLGMGVGNVILPALVKAWFPNRVGLLTASYASAMAIGTSVPALVAVPLADHIGWRAALTIWGLLALAAVPSWLFMARRPRVFAPPPLLETDRQTPADVRPHRIAVHRSPITWGLVLLFGMNALNLYAMFTWLPVRLVDAGLSESAAGTQLALFAGIGILPSLLLPGLLARIGRSGPLATLCVALFAVGYLGLLLAPTTGTWLWTALAGMGGGGFPLALTLFGLRSATPASAGALAGFVQGIGYLGAASGPFLVGLLHDLSDGWALPFGFLGVTLAVMLVGARLSSPSRTVDEDLRPITCRAVRPAADTLVG
jgi:CP family cyanate transporter-like MFS transporter